MCYIRKYNEDVCLQSQRVYINREEGRRGREKEREREGEGEEGRERETNTQKICQPKPSPQFYSVYNAETQVVNILWAWQRLLQPK